MEDAMSTFNFVGNLDNLEMKASDVARLEKIVEYAKAIDNSSNPDEAAHYYGRSEELVESYDFSNIDITKESDVLPFLVAGSVGFLPLLEKWKSHGLSLDVADSGGLTALHYIALNPYNMRNLLNTTRFLLHNGVNVNALQIGELNPLQIFGFAEGEDYYNPHKYSLQIIVELVNEGADINGLDEYGYTPLYNMLDGDDVASNIEIFLNLGSDLVYDYKSKEMCFLTTLTRRLDDFLETSDVQDVEDTLKKAEMAVRHVTKLEIFGLQVSERVQSSTSKLMQRVDYVRKVRPTVISNHLLSRSSINNFKKECESEKQKMKMVRLDGVNSVYDLAVKSEGELLEFTYKKVFQDYIKSNDYIRDFPIYWFILRTQSRAAEERRRLLPEAKDHLESYDFPLHKLCLHHILKHFTNRELHDFIVANTLYML